MSRQLYAFAVLLAVVAVGISTTVRAADATQTTIQVKEMCCNGCAKKITARLYEVRGVTSVQCDIKTKTVLVTSQQGVALSPRALWEAIEKAPDQPVRLAGPSGTFTAKPRF